MPSVVVDSVLVEAGWDPSALERGLALSERLVRDFVASHPQVTVGVDGREVDGLNAKIKAIGKTPIILPPVVVPPLPPIVPPTANLPPIVLPPVVPPDFTAAIQASQNAASQVRDTFIRTLDAAGVMEHSGVAAGVAVVRGLEAGALSKLSGIGKQVAAGLLSPADAVKQADLIVETLKREIQARQGELTALVAQARQRALGSGTTPNISGVTTARTGVGSTAELVEAEKGFDRLTGASELTNQAFVRVGSSSSAMRLGVRQAANSLSILAAQSIGTTGTVGRLAESVVLLGSGFSGAEGKIGALVGKVGIAAGVVLGAAKTYQFLHAAQDEAKKSQEALLAGLLSEATAMSASEKAARGLAAALNAQAEARSKTFRNQALGALVSGLTQSPGLGVEVGAELARRQQQEVANATKAVTQAQRDQAKAFTDTNAAEAAALTEGITLRVATTKEIQRSADFLPILKRLSQDANLPLAERIAFSKELVALQQAQNAGVEQEIALRAAQAAAEATRITALAAAPGLGTDTAVSVRERATELARLNAIIHSGTASLTERNDAAEKFNALVAGAQVPLDRQRKAAQDIADAEASAFHDVAEAFAAALGVVQAAIDTLGERAGEQFAKLIKKQQDAAKEAANKGNIQLPDTGISAGFDRAQGSVRDLNEQLTIAAGLSNKFFAAASGQTARVVDRVRAITRALDDVVNAARGVGAIGDEAVQSIGKVLDLVDALGSLKQANENLRNAETAAEKASASLEKLAAVGGLIGAGIGIIGSLAGAAFGKSPGQIESDRIMEENNQRLAELRSALDRSIQGVGGQVKIGAAARGLATEGADVLGRELTIPGVGTIEKGMAFLQQEALKCGGTCAQLQAIAKENGIQLLDSHGRIVIGAFDALANATGATIAAMTKFGTSFADEVSFADLTAKINGGIGDAVDQFQRDLGAVGKVTAEADPTGFIQHFFDGIDIRGDSAAFQKKLQELLKLFAPDSTFFTQHPELLGGLTPEDWKKLLNDGADAMGVLTDKTLDAAKNLGDLSVPQGFRRAAIAFQTGDVGPDPAQLAARTAAVSAQFFQPPIPVVPATAPEIKPLPDDAQALLDRIATKAPPDLLAAVQDITATIVAGRQTATTGDVNAPAPASTFGAAPRTQTTTVTIENINLTISGEHQDPNKMADDFFAALRRKALVQSGDSLQQFGLR